MLQRVSAKAPASVSGSTRARHTCLAPTGRKGRKDVLGPPVGALLSVCLSHCVKENCGAEQPWGQTLASASPRPPVPLLPPL
ncbi:hypothetical protein E2C01_031604 [Portunus trituberculatus]|uniref:Uncharacterized protein n=1 Tax=Portunus trituberculatus TaxID=210409 RepID=A0A5B7EUZ9_PORTR|nr:hypothetical protein [Portunus trituberculatus]